MKTVSSSQTKTGRLSSEKKTDLLEFWIRLYLQVSVDHEAIVHVFQTQDDLGGVEAHLLLAEDAVLRQVVVQVSS